MVSPINYSYDRILSHLIEDYNKLGQIEVGQKLEIVNAGKEDEHLEISSGTQKSYLGHFLQSASRTYKQVTGTAAADRESIVAYLIKLNAATEKQLKELENTATSSLQNRISQLTAAMNQASKGIEKLQQTYEKEEETKNNLEFINEKIKKLKGEIEAFLPPRSTAKEEVSRSFKTLSDAMSEIKEEELDELTKSFEKIDSELAFQEISRGAEKGDMLADLSDQPNSMGWKDKIYRGINTLFAKAQATYTPIKETDLNEIRKKDPQYYAMVKLVRTPGAQLNNFVLTKYLEILQNSKDTISFEFLQEFYVFRSITELDFEKICRTIKKGIEEFDLEQAICIPIVVKSKILGSFSNLLELQHVVVIQIKDGKINYYDPKGETSDKQKLADGKTLKDVLEALKGNEFFNNSQMEIVENTTPHQQDNFNCGAYVLHYLFQTLANNYTLEELAKKRIPINYIYAFRETMAKDMIENFSHLQAYEDTQELTGNAFNPKNSLSDSRSAQFKDSQTLSKSLLTLDDNDLFKQLE